MATTVAASSPTSRPVQATTSTKTTYADERQPQPVPEDPEDRHEERRPGEAVLHEGEALGRGRLVRRRVHGVGSHLHPRRQRALGRGDRVGVARIDREGGAERPRHRLEAGLGDMVAVLAVEIDDVQRDARRSAPAPGRIRGTARCRTRRPSGARTSTCQTRCGRPETSTAARVQTSSIGRSIEA